MLSVFDPLPCYDHCGTPTALDISDLVALSCASTVAWRLAGRLLREASQDTGTAYVDRPIAELLLIYEGVTTRQFTSEFE